MSGLVAIVAKIILAVMSTSLAFSAVMLVWLLIKYKYDLKIQVNPNRTEE